MNKTLVITLFAAFVLGVACGEPENSEGVPDNVKELALSVGEKKVESLGGALDSGQDLTVKYFEPDAAPWAGREVEIAEVDIIGRPYVMAIYDENGDLRSESFYDDIGGKCFGPEEWNNMIHCYEYTYDEYGNRASSTTLGLDGEYVASYLPPGVYRWEWVYDVEGNMVLENMFYLDGQVRELTFGEGEGIERWYRTDE